MQSTFRLLAAILFLGSASQVFSQAICRASTVGGEGIGDGCTTSISVLMPEIGAFRSTFTPACNNHDKCYTTLGTSGHECNSNFLSDMQSACRSDFTPLLRPVEYQACNQSALAYRTAVDAYLSINESLAGHQYDALVVSRQLENEVETGVCATTPERTTLYSSSLIGKVNTAFSQNAGRLPTIYEFMEVINLGNIVYDPIGWDSILFTYTSQKRNAPVPPAVGYVLSGKSLVASPAVPGATYTWKIDNIDTKEGNAIFVGTTAAEMPRYDHTRYLRGYVKATLNKGTPLEVSNVALVETSIFIRGWCSSGPTQACR